MILLLMIRTPQNMRQQYPQNPEVREIQSLRLKKKEGLDLIQKHLR